MAYLLHEVDYIDSQQQTQVERRGCSGVLIAPTVVLTAAQCLRPGLGLDRWSNPRTTITFGPTIYATGEEVPEAERYIGVEAKWPGQYSDDALIDNNDIALVWLDRPPEDAVPLRLLYSDDVAVGLVTRQSEISLVGFGSTALDAEDFALRVGRSVIERVSSAYYPSLMKLLQDPSGICDRDAGGPGLLRIADAVYVLGVMTASRKCVIGKDGYLVKTFSPPITKWLRGALAP